MPLRTFWVAATAALALTAVPIGAQTPTPEQARTMMAQPGMAERVRQQIMTSGMSEAQIRQRLRAAGYPENFLDAYLPGGRGAATPGADVLDALQRLGIAGDEDAAVMRTMLREHSTATKAPPLVRDDEPRADSLEARSYELFGRALFENASSEFLPLMEGPVDDQYRLGGGDELVLILTGEVELAHTLPVTREGFIVIPQVGQLSVAGLTMAQLEDLLYSRLSRSYSGVRRGADAPTKFSVSASRVRAIQVFVTGDVVRPASYRVAGSATAMTALYAAGGPTENGSFRTVSVRRGGRVVATLDLYDYLLRGSRESDLRLEQGDIVFVPPHGPRVRVVGEVLRPATYELREGEGLREALQAAGGFRPTALTSRVLVHRLLPPRERQAGGRDRVLVDIANGGDGRVESFPQVALHGGDELRVLAVSERRRGQVMVKGHVWTAGPQGYREGLTLSAALRAAGGLKPDAYLNQVSITRLRPDSTRVQLRAVLRDTTGAVLEDLALQEDDEITVYSVTEFRPARYVAIGGSVRRAGRYAWREGMTLRDLVLAAGGLREDAYLKEAEVARLPEGLGDGRTAVSLRVPLDSSYLGDYVAGAPYLGVPGAPTGPAGSAAEVALRPYDNVLVMQQPDWQPPRSVMLTGEVRFPGRYTLLTETDRLADVIRRAGGLTEAAAADAAYFSRVAAATSFRAAVDSAESADSATATIERLRVGLDLARALASERSSDNLQLIDGDSVHIPYERNTVAIEGMVNAPSTTTYSGRRIGYYLQSAGGASTTGNERRAYVIQPNGKIEARRRVLWVIPLDPRPRPGATVVVPEREQTAESVQRVASTVQIIAQTLASVATLVVLLR